MVDIATRNYSSRNGTKVIWVAIHTTEGIMDANDLGYYWQRITNGSSHAGCDNVKTRTYVDTAYASWTLLNGNSRSVNMEICGWARWSRDEWLGPQRGRLVQAANWARQMCDKFGIPKRYIGAAGVARGESGIIGHVDYTNGAKDGNHWDPGPGFPWDVFIEMVKGDDDMTPDEIFDAVWRRPIAVMHGDGTTHQAHTGDVLRHSELQHDITRGRVDDVKRQNVELRAKVDALKATVDTLKAKLDSIELGGVNPDEIGRIAVDAVEKKLEG